MTRGEKNNNPLNIKKSSDTFKGEVVPSHDVIFKEFTEMKYGYRAAIVILGTYISRGWNTIERIVRRWAPPSENSTERYISHVEKTTGIDRNHVLKLIGNSEQIIAIVGAMSVMEIGKIFPEAIREGFKLQTKIR